MDGSDKLFQAIIVGGGPVGLTLAHTLDQAGIDYLILEARDTVLAEEGGAFTYLITHICQHCWGLYS